MATNQIDIKSVSTETVTGAGTIQLLEDVNLTTASLTADTRLYWGTTTTPGPSASVLYDMDNKHNNDSMFVYNILGVITTASQGIFSDQNRTISVGSNGTSPALTNYGNNTKYTGMTYDVYDDNGDLIIEDASITKSYFGPSPNQVPFTFQNHFTSPGFLPMGEPVTVHSDLGGAIRGRIAGYNAVGPPVYNEETIVVPNTDSTSTYYLNGTGVNGLFLGISINGAKDDFVYMFIGNSNCYHPNTFLKTPKGEIKIGNIKRGLLVKTKNGFKKVVRVLKQSIKHDKEFVVFEKGSLGNNIPNRHLMITKGHPVFYRGKYLNSIDFAKYGFFDKIYLKKINTDSLYHIQFEGHECIETNGMWTTSLPHNMELKVPKDLYFDKSKFNPDDKGKHFSPYCLHKDPLTDKLDDDDLDYIYQFN
jgi:hypothetical protein